MASPSRVLALSGYRLNSALAPVLMMGTLICSDLLAISVAVSIGFACWFFRNPSIPGPEPYVVLLATGFSLAALASRGLYPAVGMTSVTQMRHIGHGITLAYLLLATSMVLLKGWAASSRGGIILSWAFSLVFVTLLRWLLAYWLSKHSWWGVPVVILGTGETARMVIRNLRDHPDLSFRPILCLDEKFVHRGFCEGVPVEGGLDDVERLSATYSAKYAIVAMPSMPREQLVRYLRRWSTVFRNIIVVPDLLGVASLWVEPRDLAGVLGLEIQHNLMNPFNRALKRAMDVGFAVIGLLLGGPLMVVAAFWIKRVSPGPVLYTQEREGKNGKSLRIPKLRTMFPDAEQMLQTHLEDKTENREEWDRFCKLKKDPRILPGVGNFLRKTSMDELPQLWSVLTGEMSLVGPRPFPEYHNERFHPEFRSLRTQVTPGLTGLWQISARSDGDLAVQERLDSYYIRNWSPWLDLYIIIRTARTVVLQDGAY